MKYRGAKIFGLVAVGVVVAWAAAFVWARWEFGPPYYIKDHDPELERHAADAQPVIEALEKYRLKNGAYPKTSKEIFPWFVTSKMSERDREQFPWTWEYGSDGSSYTLAYRLSHDEDLIYRYDGSRGDWVYEGDGTPWKTLKLGP